MSSNGFIGLLKVLQNLSNKERYAVPICPLSFSDCY
jgi:hypothetical protein